MWIAKARSSRSTKSPITVRDSQKIESLVEEGDVRVHADSAYRSQEIEDELQAKKVGSQIHERAYRNVPLSEEQKRNPSREKSV